MVIPKPAVQPSQKPCFGVWRASATNRGTSATNASGHRSIPGKAAKYSSPERKLSGYACRGLSGSGSTTDRLFHLRKHVVYLERLADVVPCAALNALDHVAGTRLGGEEDDRYVLQLRHFAHLVRDA